METKDLKICEDYQEWQAFELEQRKITKPDTRIIITTSGYQGQTADTEEVIPIDVIL